MHNDYILKLIEQFMRSLQVITNRRKTGQYDEALRLIQNASNFYLKIDLFSYLGLSPEEFINKLKGDDPDLDAQKSLICAELIYEVALIAAVREQNEFASHLKIIALNLYANAIISEIQYDSYKEKANLLINDLETSAISQSMKDNLHNLKKMLSEK